MKWLRSHWKITTALAVVFLVGVGIGTSGSEDAEAEPARVVTETETAAATTVMETETVTETVDPTEEQVEALDDREADLDRQAAALRSRDRALDARQTKLRRQERVAERSRFSDGVYLVGKDIPPGSYVAPGSGSCYWARLSRDGTNILDNYIGAGQARATINRGELFETSDCGTWRPG